MADVKNWLGKAIGGAIGFLAGGPVGAVVGAAIGHRYDLESMGSFESNFEAGDDENLRTAFFKANFSVMGHVAKIDGLVSKAEIDAAKSIMDRMDLSLDMRQKAIRLYTEGKSSEFPVDDVLNEFYAAAKHRYSIIRLFIDIQLETAFADGALHPSQEVMLLKICDRLHFSRFEFHMLKGLRDKKPRMRERPKSVMAGRKQPTLREAYAVLNLTAQASADEITQTYRRLISQNHPDKLTAQGKPAAEVKRANEKTQQIRKAYEIISQARNLKRGR